MLRLAALLFFLKAVGRESVSMFDSRCQRPSMIWLLKRLEFFLYLADRKLNMVSTSMVRVN